MSGHYSRLMTSRSRSDRPRLFGLYALLIAGNILAWAWALLVFRSYPLLLGTSLLAYTFGLRHAVDADHIAAIDNVTRKLMQDGQRPYSVGLYFSLGHSTVVILATVGVAAAASSLDSRFELIRNVGGVIGTSVSALFLFAIAFANLFTLVGLYRAFRRARDGAPLGDTDLEELLARRGLLGRCFGPLFRLIDRPWLMYPLGVLFGLGFDTATQIGLLGISAAEAAHDLPLWSILAFPVLFTAGMSLVDTTDSVLMVGAYGWAFLKPMRKLYYNLTMTFVSVLVALVIGSVEALGLAAERLGWEGSFWRGIAALSDNFGALGYVVVGIFFVTWAVSVAIYRLRRFDESDLVRG
jgi:nickel/cobalt transporter (NiCoT) family protein